MRLTTFFSVLALAGAALSLDDPVHFGGNVEKFETDCVPSTTTATITSTTVVTVTVSAVDAAYGGGLTSSAADPILGTLPPLTLTNTSTLTTTTFLTQTAFSASGSGSSSDCITVTVTSRSSASHTDKLMPENADTRPFSFLVQPGPWSNSSSTHGTGISLTAGVGTSLPTGIPISGGSGLSQSRALLVVLSVTFLTGLWLFDL